MFRWKRSKGRFAIFSNQSNNTMGERQLKFLEFVPLILYFTFARAADTDNTGPQWKVAFIVGGVLSVLILSVLMRHKGYILNRVMLGANLFLISGAVAVVLRLNVILDLYRRFNPAPMFAWVIAVGLAATAVQCPWIHRHPAVWTETGFACIQRCCWRPPLSPWGSPYISREKLFMPTFYPL